MDKSRAGLRLDAVEDVEHCGWLYKHSSGFGKSWVKRWFVLAEDRLLVFRSNKPAEVSRAVVDVTQYNHVAHDPTFAKSPYALVLAHTPDRPHFNAARNALKPLFLYAESRTGLDDWVDALRFCLHSEPAPVACPNIIDVVMRRLDYQHPLRPSFSNESLPGLADPALRRFRGHSELKSIDTASLESEDGTVPEMGRRACRSLQLTPVGSPRSILDAIPEVDAVDPAAADVVTQSLHDLSLTGPGRPHPAPEAGRVSLLRSASVLSAGPVPSASPSLSRVAPSPLAVVPVFHPDELADKSLTPTTPKSPGRLASLRRRFSQSAPLDYEKYLQLMRVRLHSQAQQTQV
ncbi:hypothetical protein IWQ60_012489, partial [Tieghemiomyces parasiticus]